MYSYIKGKIIRKTTSTIEIEVNGFGFELLVSLNSLSKLGEVGDEIIIYTIFLFRDDNFQVYGFATQDEREIFQELIKISGIGPKIALAILSYLEVSEFIEVVKTNDIKKLVKLPGIGRKTSERILLEFREKIKKFDKVEKVEVSMDGKNLYEEAITALSVLGYQEIRVKNIVKEIISKSNKLTIEELLKQTLKVLNK
ncbi:MAG: Holliday junction branch migration protein RuvA [Ignavibacteria bacterium]|nr:Holliday junction branch migration protein RuvA [Ignavibacteria bacterium]